MLLHMSRLHSFPSLNNIPLCDVCVCVCVRARARADIFFIHSFVDGHLDCFYMLAMVNDAAMNIEVHTYLF